MVVQNINLELRYKPRAYQLSLLQALDRGCKRAVAVWHRRAGKDLTVFNYLLVAALRRVGNYYYYFPSFTQGRKILWDGKDYNGVPFLDYIPKVALRGKPLDTEMKITLVNGSIIQVLGTDDPDRLVGPNPVGVVFSEYSLQNPKAWELVKPILRENGGFAIFIFTPRGRNHGYALYKTAKNLAENGDADWFYELLTINDTRREDGSYVISPEDVEKEILEGMDPDLAQQEYYCAWEGSMQGAYYAKQMAMARKENRVTRVPWEPGLPVHTAWDLGMGDNTAIWFYQVCGKEIRMIDFLSGSGEGLPHYIKHLREKPYVYGEHKAPHDIKVRELGTGRSRLETARELGVDFDIVAKLSIADGIDAGRRLFPQIWWDAEKCEEGLDALTSYSKEYDPVAQCFKTSPKHDWASNAADAYRTFAVGFDEIITKDSRQTYAESNFDVFDYSHGPSLTAFRRI